MIWLRILLEKYGKLNAREKDLFIRDQTINFVYTTLRTENVLVSRKDVSTAYDLFDDASKRVKVRIF